MSSITQLPRWLLVAAVCGLFAMGASLPLAASARSGDPCRPDSLMLRGTIRNSEGAPADEAVVKCTVTGSFANCSGSGSYYKALMTGPDGEYSLRVPVGRTSLSVEATDRYGPAGSWILADSLLERDLAIDYRLEIYTIDGLVLGPGGIPLENGTASYYPDPGASLICGTGISEATIVKGRFRAVVRHRGQFRISIASRIRGDGLPFLHISVPVRGDTTVTISLDGHQLRGRVVGPRGLPLRKAVVTARGNRTGGEATTDSMGAYQMWLLPGEYRWTVDPEESWIQTRDFGLQLVSTRARRNFDLSGVTWTGTVVDEVSNSPLDSIDLHVFEGDLEHGTGQYAYTQTANGGRFRVVLARGSRYWINLSDARLRFARVITQASFDETPERREARFARERDETERRFALVRKRTIEGLTATTDSTFVIRMEPVRKH